MDSYGRLSRITFVFYFDSTLFLGMLNWIQIALQKDLLKASIWAVLLWWIPIITCDSFFLRFCFGIQNPNNLNDVRAGRTTSIRFYRQVDWYIYTRRHILDYGIIMAISSYFFSLKKPPYSSPLILSFKASIVAVSSALVQ